MIDLIRRHCWLIFLVFLSGCADDEDPAQIQLQKPAALPHIRLYSDQSPFNQKIPADTRIDPDSAGYVAVISKTAGHLLIQVRQYSSPVYFADENSPRYNIPVRCGPVWELGVSALTNVPIPDFAEPSNDTDGAGRPIRKCGEDSDQDNNMVILDLKKGCEYDLWQARREDGRWVASWANAVPLDGNGIYEAGLSTRGSGFAFLAGVIWPHELQQGEIPHALLFALPDKFVRKGGPVSPATESDGESEHPFALPEGARLRLDPSLDLNTLHLTPAESAIAKAMQEYGMFLSDQGGDEGFSLYAVDPLSVRENPYANLLPELDYPVLANIPLEKLRVMFLPPQNPDFQQNVELPDNGCAEFERSP